MYSRYLVNRAGYYLNAWYGCHSICALALAVFKSIQIRVFRPVKTQVLLSGNQLKKASG